MHLGNGQRAAHRAMARGENMVFYLAHAHIVTVDELIEFGGQGIQKILDRAGELLHFSRAGIGGSDMAAERLDMNGHIG